jgi:Tol biopolymer transport system component
MVSVTAAGRSGNAQSWTPSVSADGRYVAFSSYATDLVPGDGNGTGDVFVRDRVSRTTVRVSVDSAGLDADAESWSPSVSADGRYVAFTSDATDLVPGDTNGVADVFVRNLRTGVTVRVSVPAGGGQADGTCDGPSLSADGRIVAFNSLATNMTSQSPIGGQEVYVRDLTRGTTTMVSVPYTGAVEPAGGSYWQGISADGWRVVFVSWATNLVPGDTNGTLDVFVRDLVVGRTVRASVPNAGGEATMPSYGAAISGDGRYVGFNSDDPSFVPGDTNNSTDVFIRDLAAGTTRRVSVSAAGAQGTDTSAGPALSADGRYVAFLSAATNLVPGDTNGHFDVFVRDQRTGRVALASVSTAGRQANADCGNLALSRDGVSRR